MPIAALPQETVRVLTSSLALNDAISVVKELIDNALDAAASSITIEISSNTLDIIQIKDNGKGIGIEDRQLLCKRGCTSKIRTIEDLTTLGGKSLGFRGEALASVASTSDAVMITTRIEGELVGTALKFGANGKILRFVASIWTLQFSCLLSQLVFRFACSRHHCTRAEFSLKCSGPQTNYA